MTLNNSQYKKLLLLGASKLIALTTIQTTVNQTAYGFTIPTGVAPGPVGAMPDDKTPAKARVITLRADTYLGDAAGGGDMATSGAGDESFTMNLNGHKLTGSAAANSIALAISAAANPRLSFKLENTDAGAVSEVFQANAGNTFSLFLVNQGNSSATSMLIDGSRGGGITIQDIVGGGANKFNVFSVDNQVANTATTFTVKGATINLNASNRSRLLNLGVNAGIAGAKGAPAILDINNSTINLFDDANSIAVNLGLDNFFEITHAGTIEAGRGNAFTHSGAGGGGGITTITFVKDSKVNAVGAGGVLGYVLNAKVADTFTLDIQTGAKMSGIIDIKTANAASAITVGSGVLDKDGNPGFDVLVNFKNAAQPLSLGSDVIRGLDAPLGAGGDVTTTADVAVNKDVGATNALNSWTVGANKTTTLKEGTLFKTTTVKLNPGSALVVNVDGTGNKLPSPVELKVPGNNAKTLVQFNGAGQVGALNENLGWDGADVQTLEKIGIGKGFTLQSNSKRMTTATIELQGDAAAPAVLEFTVADPGTRVGGGAPYGNLCAGAITDTTGANEVKFSIAGKTFGNIGTQAMPVGKLTTAGFDVELIAGKSVYVKSTNIGGNALTINTEAAHLGDVTGGGGTLNVNKNFATDGEIGTAAAPLAKIEVDAFEFTINNNIYVDTAAPNGVLATDAGSIITIAKNVTVSKIDNTGAGKGIINVLADHTFAREATNSFATLNVKAGTTSFDDTNVATVKADTITVSNKATLNVDGKDRNLTPDVAAAGVLTIEDGGILNVGSHALTVTHQNTTIAGIVKFDVDWAAKTSGSILPAKAGSTVNVTGAKIQVNSLTPYINEAKVVVIPSIANIVNGVGFDKVGFVNANLNQQYALLLDGGKYYLSAQFNKTGMQDFLKSYVPTAPVGGSLNPESFKVLDAGFLDAQTANDFSKPFTKYAMLISEGLVTNPAATIAAHNASTVPGMSLNGSDTSNANLASTAFMAPVINNMSDDARFASMPQTMAASAGDNDGGCYGMWMEGLAGNGCQDNVSGETANTLIKGFKSKYYGGAIGSHLKMLGIVDRLGLAFGYLRTDSDQNDGKMEKSNVDSFIASLYSNVKPYADWMFNFILGFAHHRFDNSRKLAPGVPGASSTKATGKFDGNEFFGQIVGGYQVKSGCFVATPSVYFDYSTFKTQSFQEKGDNNLDARLMRVHDRRNSRLRLGGQVQFSYATMLTGGSTFVPQLTVRLVHDFNSKKQQVLANFNGNNSAFPTINAAKPGRNSVEVTAGGSIQNGDFTVGLFYNGAFRKRFDGHMLMLKGSYSF